MKIDNEGRSDEREAAIRRIQEYQAEQQASQASDPQSAGRADQVDEIKASQGDTQALEAAQDDAQRAATATDTERQLQTLIADAQRVAEAGEAGASGDATGNERSAEAVETASKQQDRAQAWQTFAADAPAAKIPPSVEAQAADQQAEAQRQEQQRINVGDLLNQMAIQGGKINA